MRPLVAGVWLVLGACSLFLPAEFRELERMEIFSVAPGGDHILLDGVINSSAFDEFKALSEKYPNIKKIQIVNCDGSINDEVNLELSAYVHEKGFTIHLMDNGLIASGGVDFFIAGVKRTKGKNTKIGVHSWGDFNTKATDFPKEHEYHQPYIQYYQQVGFTQKQAEDFYYFTIYAAPPDDIHWMTEAELTQYGLLTF